MADTDDSNGSLPRIGRIAIVLIGVAIAIAIGFGLFIAAPTAADVSLTGVVLVVLTGIVGLRIAGGLSRNVFPTYNVAEVAVSGPITRRTGGRSPMRMRPGATPADAIVEQIEAADDDSAAKGLLVALNTPGGEVVPSEDIRRAVEEFDGPTVAYATDVCASGGYWIASGCDEIVARDGTLVGSIGVIGSTVNATDLAERLGLSYERFVAGEYKDAGTSLRELDDDDREYLQGLIDGYYEEFVDRVTDGRDLEESTVRDTEARVYLADEAEELGLIDAVGTREDAKTRLREQLGVDETRIETFEPERGIAERLRGGGEALTYAFGAGVASALVDEDGDVEIRL